MSSALQPFNPNPTPPYANPLRNNPKKKPTPHYNQQPHREYSIHNIRKRAFLHYVYSHYYTLLHYVYSLFNTHKT